jgi:peptidoglycan hydrolase CwlO-like protein
MVKKPYIKGPFDDVTAWIGSTQSFVSHTIIFLSAFGTAALGFAELDTMLLVLTTAVSLEAIYLAMFIQMSVNKNTDSLREVEEDIDEIEEGLEDLEEDIEDLVEEDKEEEKREKQQTEALDQLTEEVHRLLQLVETLKKK